jgi:hypothetical protein
MGGIYPPMGAFNGSPAETVVRRGNRSFETTACNCTIVTMGS